MFCHVDSLRVDFAAWTLVLGCFCRMTLFTLVFLLCGLLRVSLSLLSLCRHSPLGGERRTLDGHETVDCDWFRINDKRESFIGGIVNSQTPSFSASKGNKWWVERGGREMGGKKLEKEKKNGGKGETTEKAQQWAPNSVNEKQK